MSSNKSLAVTVSHDKTEGVWFVLSSDVPGLNAEAQSLDELVTVISELAPDLIKANLPGATPDTPVCIQHMVSTKRLAPPEWVPISTPIWFAC